MTNTRISISLLILLLASASGTRTKLLSVEKHTGGSVAEDDDGVCVSMVLSQDYPCEEHTVTTQDGYILSLQRIPNGKSSTSPGGNRPPVLLQHGVLMDGITWLLLPPQQSLAFLLADNGFDVWIANTRGTKYSQSHASLSPDDAAYWNWTWDELVSYELPALFAYVQNQTGQNLHYAGHSQGTLMALAAFSKGQLLGMLRSAALLSPIAYVNQMTSPLATSVADNFVAEGCCGKYAQESVRKTGIDCTDLMTSFTGQNCCLNSSVLDVFLDHEPQPTSTKNMIHLSQMVRSGNVPMYDYGDKEENMDHYGQTTPPLYNMTSIPNDVPLFLSYGGADALSDVGDVKHLLDSLKDHAGEKLVVQYRADYAHADFVMAENAAEVVYNPLMAFLRLN